MGFVSHHLAFAWSVCVGVSWHPEDWINFKRHLGDTNCISMLIANVNCFPHFIESLFEVWSVFWGVGVGFF